MLTSCCHAQVGTIENEYRVFQMEVIAGDSDLETEVKQHSARFRLNYREGESAPLFWPPTYSGVMCNNIG